MANFTRSLWFKIVGVLVRILAGALPFALLLIGVGESTDPIAIITLSGIVGVLVTLYIEIRWRL